MNRIKQILVVLIIFGNLTSCKNNDSTNVETSIKDTIEQPQLDKYKETTTSLYEQFKIKYSINGNSVDVSIATDLPDDAKVSLSVSRSYWEKGDSSNEYSEDYISEQSTVGEWKNTRTISLDKKIWQSNLADNQKKMAESGIGFDVAKVSDSIEIYAVVVTPPDSPSPEFKEKGMGEDKITLYYPINGNTEKQSKYGNYQSLKTGKVYSISKATPLMPELNPSNPTEALEKVKELQTESRIKILSVKNKGNTIWYEVKAFNKNDKTIGLGWINSTSLMGQELKLK